MTRDGLVKARRLALVIQNALLNADLPRACSLLRDLHLALQPALRRPCRWVSSHH
jgi:hypothetical protein